VSLRKCSSTYARGEGGGEGGGGGRAPNWPISETLICALAVANSRGVLSRSTWRALSAAGSRTCFLDESVSQVLGTPCAQKLDRILARWAGNVVKNIRVICTGAGDDWVAAVARRCINLECINFGGPHEITDVGLTALCQCRNLKTLSVSESSITDASVIAILASCPKLKGLTVKLCQLTTRIRALEAQHSHVQFNCTVD